ncbi:MAG: hypothetical protein HY944_05210 [Gemmatimonadetes bacterium]|nr:hypothetical protein [Gemmatimonadota bacterium]
MITEAEGQPFATCFLSAGLAPGSGTETVSVTGYPLAASFLIVAVR